MNVFYSLLPYYKQSTLSFDHGRDLRIFASVGGAGRSEAFKSIIANGFQRKFIDNLIELW